MGFSEDATEFDKIVAGLGDLEFSPADIVPVSILNDAELSTRYSRVRQELLRLGEMLPETEIGRPHSETGRRLHSERACYIIELRKRGMMT